MSPDDISCQTNKNNYCFVIKFGCFHVFQFVATLNMALLCHPVNMVFSNNDVVFRVETLREKTFIRSQKMAFFLEKTVKKKSQKKRKK
jgi:hypothetical protein